VTDKYIQKTTAALLPILQHIEDEILGNYEVPIKDQPAE
jgi:hypothetical protein